MAEVVNSNQVAKPLKTGVGDFSPLDGREKIYIEDNEQVTLDTFKVITEPYPHMRIHVHKKQTGVDGSYIGDVCVGVYEVDEIDIVVEWGEVSSAYIKSYHQVYSTTAGASSEYILGKFLSFGTTSELEAYTETIKAGTYVYVEDRGEYYKVEQNSSGRDVANELNQGNADNLPDGYSAQGNYVIADKYKDVIFYCSDSEGEHKGKIYLNGLPYGGEDLKVGDGLTYNANKELTLTPASGGKLGGIIATQEDKKGDNNFNVSVQKTELPGAAYVNIPNASEENNGLMTKEQVKKLEGKADKTELAKEVSDRDNAINELNNDIQPRLQELEGVPNSVNSILGVNAAKAKMEIKEEGSDIYVEDEYHILNFNDNADIDPNLGDKITIDIYTNTEIDSISAIKFRSVVAVEEGEKTIVSALYSLSLPKIEVGKHYIVELNKSTHSFNIITFIGLRDDLIKNVTDLTKVASDLFVSQNKITGTNSINLSPNLEERKKDKWSKDDLKIEDGVMQKFDGMYWEETSLVDEFMSLRYDETEGNLVTVIVVISCNKASGNLDGVVIKITNDISKEDILNRSLLPEELTNAYTAKVTVQVARGIKLTVSTSTIDTSWKTPKSKSFYAVLEYHTVNMLYEYYQEGFYVHCIGLEHDEYGMSIGSDVLATEWDSANNQYVECVVYLFKDTSGDIQRLIFPPSFIQISNTYQFPFYTDGTGSTRHIVPNASSNIGTGMQNTKNAMDLIRTTIEQCRQQAYSLVPEWEDVENQYDAVYDKSAFFQAYNKTLTYTDYLGTAHTLHGYIPSLNEMKLLYVDRTAVQTDFLNTLNTVMRSIGGKQYPNKKGSGGDEGMYSPVVMTSSNNTQYPWYYGAVNSGLWPNASGMAWRVFSSFSIGSYNFNSKNSYVQFFVLFDFDE